MITSEDFKKDGWTKIDEDPIWKGWPSISYYKGDITASYRQDSRQLTLVNNKVFNYTHYKEPINDFKELKKIVNEFTKK